MSLRQFQRLGKPTFGSVARAIRQASTEATAKYVPPAKDVNPAYSIALGAIERSKQRHLREAERVKKELEQAEATEKGEAAVTNLRRQYEKHMVKAFINDGEVLWNAKNQRFDLSQPVYRYLKQKQWKERPLEVLMQRITQMYIVPDAIDPKKLVIPSARLDLKFGGLNDEKPIEPGAVIPPELAREPPTLALTTFHEDTKHHTLLVADLDYPNEDAQTYNEKCLWMVTNIPANMHNEGEFALGETVIPYLAPHPARGTKRHRYAFIVYRQGESGDNRIDPSNLKGLDRIVRLRDLATELDLQPIGVSFFRAEWNESVDDIYREHLGVEPPSFGPPPKPVFGGGVGAERKNRFANY
ncbi:mitochondrial 54S ribosomal protein YmL35 [Spiromyces aspiralis]|uniref:Mitochondrial 54S ribosomal protein YmL35 n=1 Tax=Spiromyces aspiralis TaxID=68401 RepID=A0ACC1HV56_9FUNG|nr:mitochondrial 54S ribosomal protein YmL35 [Spiromyces aspiralis]